MINKRKKYLVVDVEDASYPYREIIQEKDYDVDYIGTEFILKHQKDMYPNINLTDEQKIEMWCQGELNE